MKSILLVSFFLFTAQIGTAQASRFGLNGEEYCQTSHPFMFWMRIKGQYQTATKSLKLFGDLEGSLCPGRDYSPKKMEKKLNGDYQLEVTMRENRGPYSHPKFLKRNTVPGKYNHDLGRQKKNTYEITLVKDLGKPNLDTLYQLEVKWRKTKWRIFSTQEYTNRRPIKFKLFPSDKPGVYTFVRVLGN